MKAEYNPVIDIVSQYPYPIAEAVRKYKAQPFNDNLKEWEALSAGILPAVLMYLSHLLLSDLVSTGRQPAHLYHRIQSILSRPLMGHYVGFLRETARYYREEKIVSSFPELINFVLMADIDCTLTGTGKGLFSELVSYRNLLAHGRIDNARMMDDLITHVRSFTNLLLTGISFLIKYPLQTDKGVSLMGSPITENAEANRLLIVFTEGQLTVKPLLLKLKGNDLMLLEDFDLREKTLKYRGSSYYIQMKKKEVERGDGKELFDELKELLRKVRAEEALLEQTDWDSFRDRSAVITRRNLDLYADMGKFKPEFYVPRPDWEGTGNIYSKFLESDRTLLAVSGVQGTGKSALTAHLAEMSLEIGHAVLFINAQRFSFADVEWSGNPYPKYFSDLLYYSCPFDRTAVARLIKTNEDKAKKVILFIDAINEVDGLTKKWNRFIAMELLLDWIGKIAQPGLKVVVSFRLDIYEEFEYLQEGDEFMPQNLTEISFPGNHPRKAWVWELEPFKLEQARLLFEKLKGKPELGMSPDMNWEEVKTALGDKLIPVTDNPLIFQIFLRAHHGEKRISETDRDVIIMKYAEKLTGAAEAARSPWYVKVWRFIRNGNITGKERFIADIADKITMDGGIAFNIENLNKPKPNRRDKRIQKALLEDTYHVFSELKEGGLIIEEKIEDKVSGHCSNRITILAEMVIITLTRILTKIQIRMLNISSLYLGLMITTIILLLLSVTFFYGRDNFLLSIYFHHWIPAFLIGFLGVVLLLTFSPILARIIIPDKDFIPIERLGLLQKMTLEHHDRVVIKTVIKINLPSFIFSIAFLFLTFFLEGKRIFFIPYGIAGIPLIIIAIYILSFIAFPGVSNKIYEFSRINIPARQFHVSLKKKIQCYNIQDLKAALLDKHIMIYFLIVMSLTFTAVFLEKILIPKPLEYPFALHTRDLLFRMVTDIAERSVLEISKAFRVLLICLGVFLLFTPQLIISLSYYRGKAQARDYLLKLRHSTQEPGLKKYTLLYTLGIIISSCLGLTISTLHATHINSLKIEHMEKLGLNSDRYTLNRRGEIIRVDFSNLDISSAHITELYRNKKLESLSLPENTKLKVDISLLPSLRYLKTPSGSILNINKSRLSTVDLYDIDNIDTMAVSYNTMNLVLSRLDSNNIWHMSKLFPELRVISFSEEYLNGKALNLDSRFDQNLQLIVLNSSETDLKWLNKSFTKYILNFVRPIVNEYASNIELVERVAFWYQGYEKGEAKKLNANLFSKASNLKWLMITLSPDELPDSEFYSQLYSALRNLDKIETLEFIPAQSDITFFSAYMTISGRDNILSALDSLRHDPSLMSQAIGNYKFARF